MRPQQTYRIWFTPRNGSTLLCKGLEQTGIAGQPGEFFNVMDSETLCEKYQVSTYEALRSRIWELGTSPNGVFGMKHSWHTSHTERIADELRTLRGDQIPPNATAADLLADFFPNCTHIFLTRRNKIRQAVSWWKAIKDHVWHLESSQEQASDRDFYEQNYDFDALHHLFREATLRECAMQAVFSASDSTPLTLVYEDFILDFQGTIQRIVDHVGIPYPNFPVLKKFYAQTANDQSEAWVQRFRTELQEKLGHVIW